ncbi:MAG: hypothetical protein KC561_06445, partial [Myxococcales bacterium]|nr:hypothetical protein [Myxococcales bacterium]
GVEPGESVELVATVGDWFDVSASGQYHLEFEYNLELYSSNDTLSYSSSGFRWDSLVRGDADFSVP